jgi:hypothetical protein
MCTDCEEQKVPGSTYTAEISHAMRKVAFAYVPVRRMHIAELLKILSKLSVYTACRDYQQPDTSA